MSAWAERIRRGRHNTDRATEDDVIRPDGATVARPVPPIEERAPAPVYPYRGMENHGVELPPAEVLPATEWDDIVGPEWEEPAPDIAPLPVKVVTESSDEFRAFRTFQMSIAGTNPVMVLPRDRARRKAQIFTQNGATVSVGHMPTMRATDGWYLPVGSHLTIEATEPVYVVTLTGDVANLMVNTEYMVNPRQQDVGLHRL